MLDSNNAKYGWLANVGAFDYINLTSSNTRNTGTVNWGGFQGFSWSRQGVSDNNRWERSNVSWTDTWKPIDGKPVMTIPTYDDYFSLIDQSDIYAKNIEFGYGIAYGDGATSVATTMDDAYGYTDYDNNGTASTKGMRVCVVYNKTNGDQILFPLGSIGQGRRARVVSPGGSYNVPTGEAGSISYGGVRGVLSSATNALRPLTYNLYRGAGALYWIKQPAIRKPTQTADDWCASWDINYNNVVFNHYSEGSLHQIWSQNAQGTWTSTPRTAENSSDALPIRLIYK